MKTPRQSRAGFTLVEIMVVSGIVGLLAVMAIPNIMHARAVSQKNACINNLRQIDAAKHQWALETVAAPNSSPTPLNLQPYLGRADGSIVNLFCPQDNTRTTANS